MNKLFEFKALFLNDLGNEMADQGIATEDLTEYNEALPVTLDLDSLEAFWPSRTRFKGYPVTRARTKTGDEWTLLISYPELKRIKSGANVWRNN